MVTNRVEKKGGLDSMRLLLDQKDDFGEDWSSILLWKMSYSYINEKPYCEACRAENVGFRVAEVMPVQLKPVLSNNYRYNLCRN
jgi:hypothetical protein